MRDSIRGANRKSTIQHPGQEGYTITPAGQISCRIGSPAPHAFTTRMHLRHRRHDNNCNQPTPDDQKQPNFIQHRQQPVREDDSEGAEPGDEDEGNVDVPGLDDEVGVEDDVHLDGDVGRNGDDRGEVEDPAEEVEGAGEEAEEAAVFGARGYGGPVIDAAGGGNGGGELVGVVSGVALQLDVWRWRWEM